MTPSEVRQELRQLLKDIRSRTVSLEDARVRLDILETIVRTLELESQVRRILR